MSPWSVRYIVTQSRVGRRTVMECRASGWFAASLLFGLKPNDGITRALACCLLAATALFATLVPARRATKLDPLVALRDE